MIHEVIDMDNNPPKKITITRQGWSAVNCTLETEYTDDKIKTPITTYIIDDWGSWRVQILVWDQFEAVKKATTTPEVTKTWAGIKTELDKKTTTTAKTAFENNTYTLDKNNPYQQQIAKLSDMFMGDDYTKLTTEASTTTLTTIVKDNMAHLKNMFGFWNKQIDTENKTYTDKILKTLSTDELTNIDPANQTFEVKEAKDWTITINVIKKSENPNTTKEWTITITKDNNGKLGVTRTDKPAETQKTQTPT